MNTKTQNYFVYSVAVVLFVMAASELFTAFSVSPLLNVSDPILFLPLQDVLYLIAGVQLVLSAYLLIGRDEKLKLGMIVWLIVNVFIYQIGLQWTGSSDPLVCLGNLNPNFPIPPRILNGVMLLLFCCCLLGSCFFLLTDWIKNRRPAGERPVAVTHKGQIQPT